MYFTFRNINIPTRCCQGIPNPAGSGGPDKFNLQCGRFERRNIPALKPVLWRHAGQGGHPAPSAGRCQSAGKCGVGLGRLVCLICLLSCHKLRLVWSDHPVQGEGQAQGSVGGQVHQGGCDANSPFQGHRRRSVCSITALTIKTLLDIKKAQKVNKDTEHEV